MSGFRMTTLASARANANHKRRAFPGARNGATERILAGLNALGPCTAHELSAHLGEDYKRVSVMLSYLRKTGKVRHAGDVRCNKGRKAVMQWAPGAEPHPVKPRPIRDALSALPPRKAKQRSAGSGVIAPPPFRYGLLWLNAGGVPR